MSSEPKSADGRIDDLVTEPNNRAAALGDLAPAVGEDRLSSMDVLRGFALLGLLPLNMGWGAFFEQWNVAHLYANYAGVGTFRGLFSMLFGAGVVLLTSRAEARGRNAEIGDIYYRRILWLLLFGVIHQHFILWGDILYAYAIVGLFLFPLRHLSPKILIFAGILVLLFTFYQAVYRKPPSLIQRHALWVKASEADALEAAGKTLSAEQEKAQSRWAEMNDPDPEERERRRREWQEKQRSRGYWASFLNHFRTDGINRQSNATYGWHFWDACYMMLLGMALMKLGVFSAALSIRFYAILAIVGYALGLLPRQYKAYYDLAHSFELTHYFESGTYLAFNTGTDQFFRLMVTLGHVGTLVLIYKSGFLGWLMRSLAAVGRMALTNYIMQSMIVTLLFNGYGLALIGRLQYHQYFYVVLGVWFVQMVVSPIWLKYFRFGPLEWLWRSLTYWKAQPMLVKAPAAPTAS